MPELWQEAWQAVRPPPVPGVSNADAPLVQMPFTKAAGERCCWCECSSQPWRIRTCRVCMPSSSVDTGIHD